MKSRRSFAVYNKNDDQWFKVQKLADLSILMKKAMQLVSYPADTRYFYIAEIFDEQFITKDGEVISAKELNVVDNTKSVMSYNIHTGEILKHTCINEAAKATGISYSAISHRCNVYPVSPWPTNGYSFKWDSPQQFRRFTPEEVELFSNKVNIRHPIKYRNVNSKSFRYDLSESIKHFAHISGYAAAAVSNALNDKGRIGDYEVKYLI